MGTSSSRQDSRHYPYGLKNLSPGTTLVSILDRLGGSVEEAPLTASAYVKPSSVLYQLDGVQRRWDVIESHNSVGVVLYHADLDAFLVVHQFRPAVYAARAREAQQEGRPAPPLEQGFTYELCAGLVDKAKGLEEIAAEEVAEEVGFKVDPAKVLPITTAIASAGTSGSLHHIFFARVDNSMRDGSGGGLAGAGEAIEVLALPFDSAPEFVVDAGLAKSPGLCFGLLWAHGALLSGGLRGRASMDTQPLVLRPVLPA